MLGLAAVCAGLAASIVTGYAHEVRAQVGPAVPVLVAREAVPRGKLFTPANLSRYLSRREVPVRFVPPQTARFTRDIVGLRAVLPIPAGSYVSELQLGHDSPRRANDVVTGLGRIVEVPVAGAAAMDGALHPGTRVDVLVTSERGSAIPETYLALQGVELLEFRPGTPSDPTGAPPSGTASAPDGRASLRVTLRQAVLLTAAQNFARELRLVPRAPGENRRFPPTAVSARDLHP
jgi:pilus assembly protein CpaB